MDFLRENLATIIIGLVLFIIITAIVVNLIKKRKKGKNSCGCGCDNCPSASLCHKQK